MTASDRAAALPAVALNDRKDSARSETLEPVAVPSQPRADADRADGNTAKPATGRSQNDDKPVEPARAANISAAEVANLPQLDPPLKPETADSIDAKLRQKIVRFEQTKPVPFVKLLDIVEEMCGVPIVWDLETVDEEQLQKSVTLKLSQTTVGEILDTLLKQVALERRVVEGHIELRPVPHSDK
ncbi:MAG TPA: hypothetical protein VK137_06470 [Planctomycetaceae bacterium]|nr:hypothetical protein [Planctomycetaceae bacterium]